MGPALLVPTRAEGRKAPEQPEEPEEQGEHLAAPKPRLDAEERHAGPG
jgi:hypothetical protein